MHITAYACIVALYWVVQKGAIIMINIMIIIIIIHMFQYFSGFNKKKTQQR